MNRNIKKIVAITLAFGIISAALPAVNVKFFTTNAYASSSPDNLDRLKLMDKHNNNIQLYDSTDYTSSVANDDIHEGNTYYAEATTSKVKIDISGADEANVRIFKGDSETPYEVGDEITLSSGITRLKVKVYTNSYDSYNDYKDAESSGYDQYSLKVEYINDNFDNETDKLDNLEIVDDNDGALTLYKASDYKDEVATDVVEEGKTYYAKTSSDVSVNIVGPDEEYVKIFKSTADSAKGVDPRDTINISSDKTLTVRIYNTAPDSDITYGDDETVIGEYKINLKYTGVAASGTSSLTTIDGDADAAQYDKIYLAKLSIDTRLLELSDSKVKYVYNVDSNVDQITVRATPEDNDYNVIIDGKTVTKDGNYKAILKLVKGENKFKIEINNTDGDERIYTLVINRGSVAQTTATNTDGNTNKVSQWVKVNNLWQYNDGAGNPVKNNWVQNYYLKSDGNMATEWLNINGSWYYFGVDGAKKTSWQKVNGIWYYLDTAEGKMKTGWYKDFDGKWYYLYSDGSMAYNTTVGGYKLGASGAWIK